MCYNRLIKLFIQTRMLAITRRASFLFYVHISHLYLTFVVVLDRYAYRNDGSEEFDRDETTLTLIKPSSISTKDVRSVPDVRPVQDNNGTSNDDDLEEDKRE